MCLKQSGQKDAEIARFPLLDTAVKEGSLGSRKALGVGGRSRFTVSVRRGSPRVGVGCGGQRGYTSQSRGPPICVPTSRGPASEDRSRICSMLAMFQEEDSGRGPEGQILETEGHTVPSARLLRPETCVPLCAPALWSLRVQPQVTSGHTCTGLEHLAGMWCWLL